MLCFSVLFVTFSYGVQGQVWYLDGARIAGRLFSSDQLDTSATQV